MIAKGENVRLWVLERCLQPSDMAHFSTSVKIGFRSVKGHAPFRDTLHLWCKNAPGVREVREDQNDHNSDEDGDATFDDV